MAVFFCVQKPESIYDDNRGQSYEYFQRLPNGRQIEEGDWLVFTLTGSTSKNGQKVTGLGQIESLDYQEQGRDTLITANYSRYKQFNPPLTYEQIGGDPRKNVQHTMNRVDEPNGQALVDWLLQFDQQSAPVGAGSHTTSVKLNYACRCNSCGCEIKLSSHWVFLAEKIRSGGPVCPVCAEPGMTLS